MIQRNVEGIGPYVIPAFVFAALPAFLAAFAYGILGSAMPRAGGSYIYASRGLHPYLGFIASFFPMVWSLHSDRSGLLYHHSIPEDVALALDLSDLATFLSLGYVRVILALVILWTFVWVNIRGDHIL